MAACNGTLRYRRSGPKSLAKMANILRETLCTSPPPKPKTVLAAFVPWPSVSPCLSKNRAKLTPSSSQPSNTTLCKPTKTRPVQRRARKHSNPNSATGLPRKTHGSKTKAFRVPTYAPGKSPWRSLTFTPTPATALHKAFLMWWWCKAICSMHWPRA